jgi:hypothetical protein
MDKLLGLQNRQYKNNQHYMQYINKILKDYKYQVGIAKVLTSLQDKKNLLDSQYIHLHQINYIYQDYTVLEQNIHLNNNIQLYMANIILIIHYYMFLLSIMLVILILRHKNNHLDK